MSTPSRLFSLPSPDRPIPHWHVSPLVDVMAYAFSWVWVVVPLALVGDRRSDYLLAYIVVVLFTDVHRHYGLPYVYLDRQVLSRFTLRFTVFPAVMLALWASSPWIQRQAPPVTVVGAVAAGAWVIVLVQLLRRDRDSVSLSWRHIGQALLPAFAVAGAGLLVADDGGWAWLCAALVAALGVEVLVRPEGGARPRYISPGLVLAAIAALLVAQQSGALAPSEVEVSTRAMFNVAAVFAAAWNVWHVLMQKYGILRLYNAKTGNPTKAPGWIDRLLIFSWMPFYFLWLGPEYRSTIFRYFPKGSSTLSPIIDAMEALQPYLLGPSIGLVALTIAAFVYYEWRANRLRNAPRLWMAAGTVALSSMFVVVHPVKAYLAFAFSHAVEYMVFVWAFQRRRYAAPLAHRPLLGRLLRRPVLAYVGFTLGLGGLFVVLKYWGRQILPGAPSPYFFGIPTFEWIVHWTVFQSMVHFYFDGFLWKMRLPTTRAHI